MTNVLSLLFVSWCINCFVLLLILLSVIHNWKCTSHDPVNLETKTLHFVNLWMTAQVLSLVHVLLAISPAQWHGYNCTWNLIFLNMPQVQKLFLVTFDSIKLIIINILCSQALHLTLWPDRRRGQEGTCEMQSGNQFASIDSHASLNCPCCQEIFLY